MGKRYSYSLIFENLVGIYFGSLSVGGGHKNRDLYIHVHMTPWR